jgi:prepilin-type N-terminal cleavage/methylation domain-containing protein
MIRSRAGYTLMELVVVLALLAVAAALVAPAVGRTAEDVMARAEVASVAAFLRVAREQAVTRQQTIEVSLDRDAHSLLLRRAAPAARSRHSCASRAARRPPRSPSSPRACPAAPASWSRRRDHVSTWSRWTR